MSLYTILCVYDQTFLGDWRLLFLKNIPFFRVHAVFNGKVYVQNVQRANTNMFNLKQTEKAICNFG